VILLDTHIWIWWVDDNQRLTNQLRQYLQEHEVDGFGVSIISCWEVAKLVERNRLQFNCPIERWLEQALNYPSIYLLPLTLPVILDATRLPQPFHRDPADQLIVATARLHQLPLLTVDQNILSYSHVTTVSFDNK
jgi:PIN domain nuclease of toxin-antitoxin system